MADGPTRTEQEMPPTGGKRCILLGSRSQSGDRRNRRGVVSARVVGSACMSYARRDMNGKAEYLGLIAEIQGPRYNGWQVEDKSLMLRQVREYRPKVPTTARRLADVVRLSVLHHHLRDYNKMADCADNVAMDTQAGAQVQRPCGGLTRSRSNRFSEEISTHSLRAISCTVARTKEAMPSAIGSSITHEVAMLLLQYMIDLNFMTTVYRRCNDTPIGGLAPPSAAVFFFWGCVLRLCKERSPEGSGHLWLVTCLMAKLTKTVDGVDI